MSRRSPDPSPNDLAQLRSLYEAGMSISEVAMAAGEWGERPSVTVVRRWLVNAGAEIRRAGQRPGVEIDQAELVRRYTAGASIQGLARELRADPRRVRECLVAAGCRIRRSGLPPVNREADRG